jgi:cyanophycin synthetase
MEFRKVLGLRGPNVWGNIRVLEAWVDLGVRKETASNEIAGFNERLKNWLPTLIEHRCSVGERGGFFQRLERGTYLAHILEHVALEMQSLAGTAVGFGRTRMTSEDGVYRVAVEFVDEEMGRAALDISRELCLAAADNQPFDVAAAIGRLRELAARNAPDADTAALLAAAKARRIPAQPLGAAGLVQLGYGALQCRVWRTQTDRTNAVAASVVHDNELTRGLLAAVGVPVPEGRPVTSADDAWQAVEEVGLPVLLRPQYGHPRRGVRCEELLSQQQVRSAYETLAKQTSYIVVERFAQGMDGRLLVVGDRVVAAVRRETGRSPVDVTQSIHPQVAARAVDAARVVGLDVAGVDVVAQDFGRPLEEQGGVVTAVCARPGLRSHREASPTASAAIAGALVAHLFPEGQAGRIPIVGVTGVNGKTTTTRLIAHLLGSSHAPVAMTCTEGIYLGDRRLQKGDCSGPKSARMALNHPQARAVVLETARGGILREGLGFDRCDVAVMTNIGEGDHLGASDVNTPEHLAWVKSTLVAAVAPGGTAVLNATDPLVVGMAEYCRGRIAYFARAADHPVLTGHREKGGRVAFVRNNQIVLSEGAQETILGPLSRVPLTCEGRIAFQVDNVLAAATAAWCLGVPLAEIRARLESFGGGFDQAPGRFNLMDVRGTTVVLDYGHNTSALSCLIDALGQFPHAHRSIVYSASGDRRDEDMVRQGEILGDAFDRVILYEDSYLRGRKQGEISDLFRRGLAKGQRVREVQSIVGGLKAVQSALAAAQPGELLVIQPDIIDDTVTFLRGLLAPGAGGRLITLDEALAPPPGPFFPDRPSHGLGIEVRENGKGKGVYTLRPWQKGDVIHRGWGPRTSQRSRHSIEVDRDMHVIPLPPLQLLNHSCEPNCGLLIRRGVTEMELHALRSIVPGEELTIDYATFESTIRHFDGPCQCEAPSCRRSITGYVGLPRALREAYGIYIAEHLRPAEK